MEEEDEKKELYTEDTRDMERLRAQRRKREKRKD